MTALLLAALTLFTADWASAKEPSEKDSAKQGEPFDMTGTVTKHGVDPCMEGNVQFDLHPPSPAKAVWLSPSSRHDIKVLGDAAKNGGRVHVVGTKKQGLRPDCAYVQTSKCEPAK